MRPKGAYTSVERIVDGTAIIGIWPVAPNVEFLSGQVGTTRHRRSISESSIHEPYSNRKNGAFFYSVSLNLPHDQRNISAPNATINKRSDSASTGVIIGGILAACFAVLLLLLVACRRKRRRRRAESTRANDMEYGLSRQSSTGSSDHKALSISHSDCLPQSNSNPEPAVAQPSSKRVTFGGLPTSPSSKVKVTREGIRKPPRPARPPPLLIPPVRTNREVLQGDSFGTVVPAHHPASPSSRVTSERIRKPSLPARPLPLRLHPERVARKAPKIDPNTVANSRTVTFTDEVNRGRGSLLPNPWDSDAKPQHATFESPIFRLPSFRTSVFRVSGLKVGLPCSPRETRYR